MGSMNGYTHQVRELYEGRLVLTAQLPELALLPPLAIPFYVLIIRLPFTW